MILQEFVSAGKPKRFLPGTIASEGLLAYIFVGKFMDGIPCYRQEKRFDRLGIDISRTNMCNWQIATTGMEKFRDFLDLMWKEIRSGPFMQMDESSMQVLKEPERPAQSKGFMFVNIGYTQNHKPIVIYTEKYPFNWKLPDILSESCPTSCRKAARHPVGKLYDSRYFQL